VQSTCRLQSPCRERYLCRDWLNAISRALPISAMDLPDNVTASLPTLLKSLYAPWVQKNLRASTLPGILKVQCR